MIERRASNHNYVYVCKFCKANPGGVASGGFNGRSAAAAVGYSSPSRYNDDSNEPWEDGSSPLHQSDFENGRLLGIGKGKPMAVLGGKRGRRGAAAGMGYGVGRPPRQGAYGLAWRNATGAINKPGSKKRPVVEVIRRRGRQPKGRGMVGLQV